MPLTEQQVQEELRKQGITTMAELAQKIAEQSVAKAQWDKARGLSQETDYLWSGKNYSLYHPE